MRSVWTSASDVSRFNGEVQDFLAAGASFIRRPDGLKNMSVKIVFKNHILLESLKYLFKFGNAIFRSSESFDGTRFGRQCTSDLVRGHSSPSFKSNLCDTLNLLSDTIVLNVIFNQANLLDPGDRTTFPTESRNWPFFRQRESS